MKRFFLKYLWGTPLNYSTLIALVEVLIQVPLYIIAYPKGHIFHSILWTILLIMCIFLQIKRQRQKQNEC